MNLLQNLPKYLFRQAKTYTTCCCTSPPPRHLICFKNWTADMVLDIIRSAMNLKSTMRDTHQQRMDTLRNAKVMILQEINEPMLFMAVSKAATLLGAYDVNITDDVVWEKDYNGRIFSYMADAIFVATTTHMCVQRLAEQASVPVMCMRSRTHGTIQALATVMTIIEEFGTMRCVNFAWIGPPHPVLNSYLLLCPMLGANIRFKCCCNVTPVSPLLKKISEEMCEHSSTVMKQCKAKEEVLRNAGIIVSGPTPKKEKLKEFQLEVQDIITNTLCNWIYFHTFPRGDEVDDFLFHHCNARTFCAIENMHFIAANRGANLGVDGPVVVAHIIAYDCLVTLGEVTTWDIITNTLCNWIYFHTFPRGDEVDDFLFHHCNARTFCAIENMHFVAAALMAYAIKGHYF